MMPAHLEAFLFQWVEELLLYKVMVLFSKGDEEVVFAVGCACVCVCVCISMIVCMQRKGRGGAS